MSANGQLKRYRRWLDAADSFTFATGGPVQIAVRRDETGMWAVFKEAPGMVREARVGDAWVPLWEDPHAHQYAMETALDMVPPLVDAEAAAYTAWAARRAAQQQEGEPVEEHLAEHASKEAAA